LNNSRIILILQALTISDFFLGKRQPIGYDPAMETAIIVKLVVIGSAVIAIALYWFLYR
jgi:hypothetical protein